MNIFDQMLSRYEIQSNADRLNANHEIIQEITLAGLKERLVSTDMEKVKKDVAPFLKRTKKLEIWSNDYFLLLADKIRFQ